MSERFWRNLALKLVVTHVTSMRSSWRISISTLKQTFLADFEYGNTIACIPISSAEDIFENEWAVLEKSGPEVGGAAWHSGGA